MKKNQTTHCEFCDEFAGSCKNAFVARYGGYLGDRMLFDDQYFKIVPTLGQIIEGHLLIVPGEHYCALADLPVVSLVELDRLCKYTRSVLAQRYGSCVFFEHGIRGKSSGGCGIDHAHMHAVPVMAEGVLNILGREFGGGSIESLADVRKRFARDSSYLYFEDSLAKRYFFPVDSLPSQYMRKLIAESIGNTDWDWRSRGYEPELISTVKRLFPLFVPLTAAIEG